MKLCIAVLAVAVAAVNAQQDRINLRTEMCGRAGLTLQQCYTEAQNCLDLSLSMKDILSTRSSAGSCASENGIWQITLWWHSSADKTTFETLRDAGATPEVATAIKRCVLNKEGWATNDVLDVQKVKKGYSDVIIRDIQPGQQQQATLNAVNQCEQYATIDTVREYTLCITEVCIKGR